MCEFDNYRFFTGWGHDEKMVITVPCEWLRDSWKWSTTTTLVSCDQPPFILFGGGENHCLSVPRNQRPDREDHDSTPTVN